MGRPREHDAETSDRLLAAAERISAEEGWDAVTVRRVAEQAGTTTRAVYSRFGSKRGLEEALHAAMFERLLELSRATPLTDDPRADLVALAQAYRRWATERPERYAAMTRFLGPDPAGARSPEGLETARAALAELVERVRRCAEAGLLDASDVGPFTEHLRVLAHGLADFENRGLLSDPDRSWATMPAALLDGYRSVAV